MLAATAVAAAFIYTYTARHEHETFETQFHYMAAGIVDALMSDTKSKFATVRTLASRKN